MNFKKMISVLLLFCFSFGAGSLAASVKEQRCGPAAPAAANADELALPPVKIHCSILAEDAVKAAIADYRAKQHPAEQDAKKE